jgi:hypothetical protein
VRVPTEVEEQAPARKRQRQQRLSLAAQGCSLMLLHGRRESNHWWKPARWAKLEQELEPWLRKGVRQFLAKTPLPLASRCCLIPLWMNHGSSTGDSRPTSSCHAGRTPCGRSNVAPSGAHGSPR